MTTTLRKAAQGSVNRRDALETVATACLAFARRHLTPYAAMFIMPASLRFAEPGTRLELKAAFEALEAVVTPANPDVALATETFWASCAGSPSSSARAGSEPVPASKGSPWSSIG